MCEKIDYSWQYLISQNDCLQYKNKVLTALLDQHNFLYHFEKLLFLFNGIPEKMEPRTFKQDPGTRILRQNPGPRTLRQGSGEILRKLLPGQYLLPVLWMSVGASGA